MSSTEELLRDALAAHNAGRLVVAEVAYNRVLRKRPTDPQALYGLGLLTYHSGAREKGIDYLRRCVHSTPHSGQAWNTLGSMYIETGRLAEGKAAYQRAVEVSPDLVEGWYNVAICSLRDGDREGAVQQLRRAVSGPTAFPKAYDLLSMTLYETGRAQEAAQAIAEWVAREPTNPIAQHMAAATSPKEPPPRASDEYVRTHFDRFATDFDSKLKSLGYRAPELVAAALRVAGPGAPAAAGGSVGKGSGSGVPAFSALLDAGCGTGLCGPLVRGLCRTLVGVDLSPNMLAGAQQRGCYDELVTAELGAFMRARPRAFEAIVCADTFVYFGALAEPLSAAHESLREAAPLVFTVEALPESDAADHRLEASGRYAHSESYLRRVLRETGFGVESIGKETLRAEIDAPVKGYLVVARRL
jgi:predicted TPR repeat methyltransferase